MSNTAKEWIKRLVSQRSFSNVSTQVLEDIAAKMETVEAAAGETIVRQGETADYYYIIQEGQCRIVNRESVMDDTMELATLGPGKSFGEEGLIRDGVRGATVEMVTDGSLVRLSKDDFVELIQRPLLKQVDWKTAVKMGEEGAQWIDLRPMKAFAKIAIPKSKNIPTQVLRAMLDTINQDEACIVCSDTVAESALGTFILAERGFDAYYLDCSVLEFLGATGQGDPETLKTLGFSAEEGVIELPEEFASLSTDSFLFREEDEDEDEEAISPGGDGNFINLDGEVQNTPTSSTVERFLDQIRSEVDRLLQAERKNLERSHAEEITALHAKHEQKLRETKDRYRTYFQEKEKQLKKKYQQTLDKYRQNGANK
jgi:rhodanese-related sulfurtransferase